ncbi:MAG: hypothetical protein QM820_63680 [Minicystis sp.]
MTSRVTSSSFSHTRYPKPLADALARSQAEPEDTHAWPLFPEDHDWAAVAFMVTLLLHAKLRRAPLDRARASDVLRAGGSEVIVEHLEARGFVRFVLGRLQIPAAVQAELAHRRYLEQLPEDERAALIALDEAREEKTALVWVDAADAERLHHAHSQAHRRTPSLEALCESGLLARAKEDNKKYDLPLSARSSNPWSTYMGSRALGLYWEELVRDEPLTRDDDLFSSWLDVALETYWWASAPRWMRRSQNRKENFVERFLDAAMRCILSEPDLLHGHKELERIRWSHDGFGFHGAPSLPPLPGRDDSLLDLYEWWSHGHFGHIEDRCREQLDGLISLVMYYDRDSWAYRAVRLVEASRERPHLMYKIGVGLLWHGRPTVAGLVANLDTASIGMRILTKLTVADGMPIQNWQSSREDAEAKKTKIWREAVSVLLATVHAKIQEGVVEAAARVLAETLIISARAMREGRLQPAEEEVCARGAEARFGILLSELDDTRCHILIELVNHLQKSLVEQAAPKKRDGHGFHKMPIAVMRILLWLLRTTSSMKGLSPFMPTRIADSLLSLYCAALRRELASDENKIVPWLDDAPETVSLPWLDLIVFLHQRGLAHRFVEPEGVDFEHHIRRRSSPDQDTAPEVDRGVRRQLSLTWLRKTRLHIRILVHVHEAIHKTDSEFATALTNEQRGALLSLVEKRLRKLVTTHAAVRYDGLHHSLFDPDKDLHLESVRSTPSLLKLLIRAFNQFSEEERNAAFAEWVAVEDDPAVLLTILDEAVPVDAKHRAASKLQTVDLDRFLGAQWTVTRIEQVAEAAAMVPDQTAVVERVLKYGDAVVQRGYRSKWEAFAYRMRLMVAYHQKDLAALERVPAPGAKEQRIDIDGDLLDPAEDTRAFYRALLLIQHQPEQAHGIFDELLRRRPGSASDAINRFSASINWAKKLDDADERHRVLSQALHDWEKVAASIPSAALAGVRNNIAYLRLACFDGAKQDERFDAEWAQLDAAQWASLEFVTLGVDNARRRGLLDRVGAILDRARPYYADRDNKLDGKFAKILHDLETGRIVEAARTYVVFSPADNIPALRRAYHELQNVRAEEAAQIVGQLGAQLHDFLLDVLYGVALECLERVVLLERLSGENQRNDLMVSLLRMRLQFLRWDVRDQPRGGRSETGKDAGERDWVIYAGSEPCAIFEALRLRSVDRDEIKKHVEKAVSGCRYNAIGVPRVYVVVYYEGKSWEHFWTEYRSYVQTLDLGIASPVQRPDSPRASYVRRERLVYDDGSGMPIHVCHLAMKLSS